MRGRKPKPTHLKLLQGNPGRRSLNRNEPVASGDLHAPPEWFSDAQKDDWTYAIANAPLGLLKRIDREMLAIWVVACDMLRRANQAQRMWDLDADYPLLNKQTVGGDKSVVTYQPSPYIGIMQKQSLIMVKAASELGFSPASRARISLEPAEVDNANPFARNDAN